MHHLVRNRVFLKMIKFHFFEMCQLLLLSGGSLLTCQVVKLKALRGFSSPPDVG